MSMRRAIVVSGVLLVIAAGVYAYVSPWLTVSKMRKAAQAGDVDTINAHVDFPLLRESLKAWINASMAREFVKPDIRENAWSLLGLAIASKLVEVLVEAMVTPDAVRMMLEGQRPQPPSPGETGISATTPQRSPAAASDNETETVMGYESYDQFLVTYRKKTDPKDTFTLVWHRGGLAGWKLAAVRMPVPVKQRTP